MPRVTFFGVLCHKRMNGSSVCQQVFHYFFVYFLHSISYTLFDAQSQGLTFAKISATIRIVLTTSDTVNAFLRQLELRFAAVVQHCRKPLHIQKAIHAPSVQILSRTPAPDQNTNVCLLPWDCNEP